MFLPFVLGQLHDKRDKHSEEREHEDTKCSIRHIDYNAVTRIFPDMHYLLE